MDAHEQADALPSEPINGKAVIDDGNTDNHQHDPDKPTVNGTSDNSSTVSAAAAYEPASSLSSSSAASSALPASQSSDALPCTPSRSAAIPPLPRSGSAVRHHTPVRLSSLPGSSSDWDPLLHPKLDTSEPSPEAAPAPKPTPATPARMASAASSDGLFASALSSPALSLSSSSSDSNLSSQTQTASPVQSPVNLTKSQPSPAPTPTSSSHVFTHLSSSSSSSMLSPLPSPSTATSSSSSRSWFSSLGNSSGSKSDMSLLLSPPHVFPDYFIETAAMIAAMQQIQHPHITSPSAPIIEDLIERLTPEAIQALVQVNPSSLSSALSELDTRRKSCHIYNTASVKKKITKLQKLISAIKLFAMEQKIAYEKANKQCDDKHDKLCVIIDRLRSFMLMNEFNLLQEGQHLCDELFENHEEICKANIFQCKTMIGELQAVLDSLVQSNESKGLNTQSFPYILTDDYLFASPKQFCAINPAMPDLIRRRSELETRLKQVKADYLLVCKNTATEDLLPRNERMVKIIDNFYQHYNGDLTADYSPARAIEYEFARICLDERTKEGQHLTRWLNSLSSQADRLKAGADRPLDPNSQAAKDDRTKLTHPNILHFIRKFESNLVREFNIDNKKRLYLRLLIQRMLFPRLWPICSALEDAIVDEHTREKDDLYAQQSDWLRLVRLEHLGISKPFLMPESLKQELNERYQARWAKGKHETSAAQSHVPAQLPAALASLLHQKDSGAEKVNGTDTHLNSDGGSGSGLKHERSADDFDKYFQSSKTSTTEVYAEGETGATSAHSPSSTLSTSLQTSNSFTADESQSITATATDTRADISTSESLTVAQSSSSAQSNTSGTSAATSIIAAATATAAANGTSAGNGLASLPHVTRIQTLRSLLPPPPRARLRPYVSCLDCMEDITQLQSPLDMLQCLLAVARNIYKTATDYSLLNCGATVKAELGADSFFPILVYVLIHSDVPDIHRRMRFMQLYGMKGDTTSELAEHGYYLTCLEGGLMYVTQAQPDTFIEMVDKELTAAATSPTVPS